MELTVAERFNLHTRIMEYIILNPDKIPDMVIPNIERRMHFRPISAIHNTGFIVRETFYSDYDDDEQRDMFVEIDIQNPGNVNIKYSISINKSGQKELFEIAKAKITSSSYIIEDVIMNDYRDKYFFVSGEIEKIKEREKKHYHDNIEAYKIKSKRYYETHKDQFKEYRKTHYHKYKEEMKERRKQYYQNNKEKEYANMKKYYENNREQLNEYRRNYYHQNREHLRELQKGYITNNPEVKQNRQDLNKEYNNQTRSSAHNHRQVWTREEVDILIELKQRNVLGKDIASRLGRTLKAIQSMENKIRREGHPFNGNPVDI